MRIDGIVHANHKFRLIYWCDFAFFHTITAIVFHESTFPIHANKSIFTENLAQRRKKNLSRLSLWILHGTHELEKNRIRLDAAVYYRLLCPLFSTRFDVLSIRFVQMVFGFVLNCGCSPQTKAKSFCCYLIGNGVSFRVELFRFGTNKCWILCVPFAYFSCGYAPWCDILYSITFFQCTIRIIFVLSAVVNHRHGAMIILSFSSRFVRRALAIRLHISTSIFASSLSALHHQYVYHFNGKLFWNELQPRRQMAVQPTETVTRWPIVNATNSNRDSRNFCTRTLSMCCALCTCVKNWTFYFSIRQILIKEFL